VNGFLVELKTLYPSEFDILLHVTDESLWERILSFKVFSSEGRKELLTSLLRDKRRNGLCLTFLVTCMLQIYQFGGKRWKISF
jgi:hypothetical protein